MIVEEGYSYQMILSKLNNRISSRTLDRYLSDIFLGPERYLQLVGPNPEELRREVEIYTERTTQSRIEVLEIARNPNAKDSDRLEAYRLSEELNDGYCSLDLNLQLQS